MEEYSPRDHRAHRDLGRGFVALAAVTVGLILLALVVPWPWVAIAAVLTLAAVGAVSVAWSDRLLARYVEDLREARVAESMRPPLVERSPELRPERPARAPPSTAP